MATLAQPVLGNFSVGSGTTIAKPFGSPVTAGNLLVAVFLWGSSSQTGAVSGSLNGAFTAVVGSLATNASGPFRGEIFFKIATSSGAETLTGTSSGSNTQREIVIYEFAGAAAAGQPDSSIGGNGSSTNPTASITAVGQPGVIVAYGSSTAGTIAVGSGYTSDVAQNGDLGQHKSYAATGAISVPFVDASSGQWIVTAAAFRDAAATKSFPFQRRFPRALAVR